MSGKAANPEGISLGIITTDRGARQLVEVAGAELESALGHSLPGFSWNIEHIETGEPGPPGDIGFLELVRAEQVRRDLDFAFAVTTAELPGGPSRTTDSITARSLSIALVPVRHLGSLDGAREAEEFAARFLNLFLHLLGLLLGLRETDSRGDVMGFHRLDQVPLLRARFSDADRVQAEALLGRVAGRSSVELIPRMSKALVYLKVLVARPLQITRRALACRPWRLVARLHKLVFPAVVAVPLALISQEVWDIGVKMNGFRLAGIALAVIVFVTAFIIAKQRLLEKMPEESPSDQVAVFNVSTTVAILLAVTIVMTVVFAATLVITTSLFPKEIVKSWLNVRALTAGDYLRVSLLIGVLSSLVGWLGAGFTESDEFRLMLYTGTRAR